jgi:Fe-S oxidoreductase
MDFLEVPYPVHICQFTLDLIRRGALKLDKSGNDDVLVTYHDPCNVARAGQLTEEPREIIHAVCNRFVEMPANTIREKTFCCGSGGGLLTDEIMPVRWAGGKPRAEACRFTGANYLATPCAICKAGLPEVMKHWKVDCTVGGVHDLVSKALIL